MFERPHHQRIAHVLTALDGATLRQHGCLFGGGTCIALRHGEYRESADIDFLVSDPAGYRALRHKLTGPHGLSAITRNHAMPLVTSREIRADHYGIRTQVLMDGQPIKYRLNGDGTFALYSVGDDGRDDGGDLSLQPEKTRLRVLWDRKDYVWPAPATPEEVAEYRRQAGRN